VPVEPRLEDDRGRRAVDPLAGRTLVDALLAEPALGLARREPLVVKLDGEPRPLAELLSEAPGTPRGRSLLAAERARQADHEKLDVLGGCQRGQGVHGPAGIPAVQMGPRVRQEAKLVRYSDTDAHLADIDGRGSHAASG